MGGNKSKETCSVVCNLDFFATSVHSFAPSADLAGAVLLIGAKPVKLFFLCFVMTKPTTIGPSASSMQFLGVGSHDWGVLKRSIATM